MGKKTTDLELVLRMEELAVLHERISFKLHDGSLSERRQRLVRGLSNYAARFSAPSIRHEPILEGGGGLGLIWLLLAVQQWIC